MPPPTEKYQKACGTMLRLRRSEAIHCTTKRAEKSAWPSRPMVSQRCSAVTRSGRPAEHRDEDLVRLADVLGSSAAGHEREDLLGFLARDRGGLVGPHIGEFSERNLERHRDAVETVDGDGLLAA